MSITAFEDAAVEIRAVIEQIKNAWTDYPLVVEYDNRKTINLATQVKPFLCVSIINLSGGQLDLGAAPRSRQWGQIQLAVAGKVGTGTADLNKLLGFIAPYLDKVDLVTVRCQTFALTKDREEKEWYYRPAIVPFYYVWE